MNRNLWLLTAAFALLVTPTASAQKTELKVDVPFDFIVNGATLPAGEYSFESADRQGKVLWIRSADSRTVSTLMPNDKQAQRHIPQSKLVFHRYGDQYFLAEIWVAGNDIGRQMPQSRREKELAMNTATRDVALSAARH